MDTEFYEIRQFLSTIPPFNTLPVDDVTRIIQAIKIGYHRRDETLALKESRLLLIRSGALSLFSPDEVLLDKLGEGDIHIYNCLEPNKETNSALFTEDALVYSIDCATLDSVLSEQPEALAYLQRSFSYRLRHAVNDMQQVQSQALAHSILADMATKSVVTAQVSISIREAAQVMKQNKVSSLLVLDGDELVGILTDDDMTRKCVAEGVDTQLDITHIMTKDPITASSQIDSIEALTIMARNHIQHLPVMDNNRLLGIVSLSDLMREQRNNSVQLSNGIRRATSLEQVVEYSQMLPQLQRSLIDAGVGANYVSQAISSVTSSIIRKLIGMAEDKLGEPPVPYVWFSAGSHARREQSSHSDQDNALIIDNRVKESEQEWYEALSTYVSDGLDACGYIYCPGGIMAMNPRWRQTQEAWRDDYMNWVLQPKQEALLNASIFFDARGIHGEKDLLESIREQVLDETEKNSLFTTYMARNALKHRPPLGFFRDFVLISDGEHKDKLDLKLSGIIPIVDLARVYALSEGKSGISTSQRIEQVAGTPTLSQDSASNLRDAFEVINTLRIQHQVRQFKRGDKMDNYLLPVELSRLERRHLKDAFKVIELLQDTIASRVGAG